MVCSMEESEIRQNLKDAGRSPEPICPDDLRRRLKQTRSKDLGVDWGMRKKG